MDLHYLYNELEEKVEKTLDITQDEFMTLLPRKYRDKNEAQNVYNHVKLELDKRRKLIKSIIKNMKMIYKNNQKISDTELDKKIATMKQIQKVSKEGIVAMRKEVKRRKEVQQTIKNALKNKDPVDENLVANVNRLIDEISHKL